MLLHVKLHTTLLQDVVKWLVDCLACLTATYIGQLPITDELNATKITMKLKEREGEKI